jgi:predicted DNA-binding transcriptional regulator AlpA
MKQLTEKDLVRKPTLKYSKDMEYMDRKVILETLGISKSTLRRWMLEEGLPYFKISRRVFFRMDEFNNWFERFRSQ